MSQKRVKFCGVIEGSVTPRPGESEQDAISRAELAICDLLGRNAKRYARTDDMGGGDGPIVGLEPYT